MEKKFEFKPFDKVLVRNNNEIWKARQFECFDEKSKQPYITIESFVYDECIPYEGNEHLLGTTESYEPPYEPKKGDFVCIQGAIDNALYIGIFKGIRDEGGIDVFIVREMLDKSHASEDSWFSKDSKILRQATEEESQFLLEWVHEEGREWDAEKCKVVDYERKPKEGETYYTPVWNGRRFWPMAHDWKNTVDDDELYEKGWVFMTRNECQEFCDKLDKVVSEVK